MRLWTYQHPAVAEALARGEVVRGDWARVERGWRPAYERLVRELVARGLQDDDRPPMWAWHSWTAWQDVPNDEAATLLLSQHDREQGVVRLVLEAPDQVALLGWYTTWNELLEPDGDAALWDELHRVAPPAPDARLDDWRSGLMAVQAALPRLDPAWVVSVAPLMT